MSEKKEYRLSQVAKELGVSLQLIVSYFRAMNVHINAEPNAKITVQQKIILEKALDVASKRHPGVLNNIISRGGVNSGEDLAELEKKIRSEDLNVDLTARKQPETVPTVQLTDDKEDEPSMLQVEIEIPEHFTDEQATAFIADLSLTLDEAYRDLGGSGLKIKDLQVQVQHQAEEVWQ